MAYLRQPDGNTASRSRPWLQKVVRLSNLTHPLHSEKRFGTNYPTPGTGFLAGEFPGGAATVEGVPTQAEVRVLWRGPAGHAADGVLVSKTQSAPDGTWRVEGLNPNLRYDVVGRLEGRNDVIASNVQPVRTDVITYSGEFTNTEDFNGVEGFITIESGLPPFTASVIEPLPHGLFPAIDGRKLIIDGTSDDEGVWDSVVRVTASNGVWMDVPVNILIGLKAPTNLKAAYAVTNDWEVSLTWTDVCTFGQGYRVYRSTTPMDAGALPAPLATLAANATSYVDPGLTPGQTYYYRVSCFCGISEVVGAELVRRALWTPADLASPPQVWLDWGSDIVSVSNKAESWSNSKGSIGGSFSQGSLASMPTVDETGVVRKLTFDESDILTNNSDAARDIGRNKGAVWAFSAYEAQSRTSSNASTILSVPDSVGNPRFEINSGYGTTADLRLRPYTYACRQESGSFIGASQTADLVEGTLFGGANFSGGSILSKTPATSIASAYADAGLVSDTRSIASGVGIGGTAQFSQNRFKGAIYCLLVGDGSIPSEQNIKRLQGWASHACGMTSNLPVDHPYKTIAP